MGWWTDGESNRAGKEKAFSVFGAEEKEVAKVGKKLKFGREWGKHKNHTMQKLMCSPKFWIIILISKNIFPWLILHGPWKNGVTTREARQAVLFPFRRLGSRSSVPRVAAGARGGRDGGPAAYGGAELFSLPRSHAFTAPRWQGDADL